MLLFDEFNVGTAEMQDTKKIYLVTHSSSLNVRLGKDGGAHIELHFKKMPCNWTSTRLYAPNYPHVVCKASSQNKMDTVLFCIAAITFGDQS